MDKEQTKLEIDALPLFELVDVAVKKNDWVKQPHHKAVVELNKDEAITYVSKRYKLIQFKEILQPIVDGINDFSARIIHHRGVCVMEIFPKMNEFEYGNYGLTVINSVDKSTAIVIKFNVKVNGDSIIFPKKMAAFCKHHTGAGFKITQDYIEVITKIKDSWKNITKHFPEFKIKPEEVETISKHFGLNKDNKELLTNSLPDEYNLWDVVQMKLKQISAKKYKSDVHKNKALEKLGEEIYNYALIIGI